MWRRVRSTSQATEDSHPVLSVACQMSLSLTRAARPPLLEGAGLVNWAEEGLMGKEGLQSPHLLQIG